MASGKKSSSSMIHSETPEVYYQLPEGNGVPGKITYWLQNDKTFSSLILPYFLSIFQSQGFGKLCNTVIFASEDFKNKNHLDAQTQKNKLAGAIVALKFSLKERARKAKEKDNSCSQLLSEKHACQVFSTSRH